MIPLVARLQQRFSHWLQPAFGDFTLDYDVDRIDALASEREKEWARLGAASFLTDDEKREAVGYGKLPRSRKDDFAAADVVNAEAGDGSGGDAGGGDGAWVDQPRVPAGNGIVSGRWTAEGASGAATMEPTRMADVISICVVGSSGISTDEYGQVAYRVTYDCPGGQSIVKEGRGRYFPGIILDPFRGLS